MADMVTLITDINIHFMDMDILITDMVTHTTHITDAVTHLMDVVVFMFPHTLNTTMALDLTVAQQQLVHKEAAVHIEHQGAQPTKTLLQRLTH